MNGSDQLLAPKTSADDYDRLVGGIASGVNRVNRLLSRSERVVTFATKVHNQCNLMIGQHPALTSDGCRDGECWLLDRVAPHVSSCIDLAVKRGAWSAALFGQPHRRSARPLAIASMLIDGQTPDAIEGPGL